MVLKATNVSESLLKNVWTWSDVLDIELLFFLQFTISVIKNQNTILYPQRIKKKG